MYRLIKALSALSAGGLIALALMLIPASQSDEMRSYTSWCGMHAEDAPCPYNFRRIWAWQSCTLHASARGQVVAPPYYRYAPEGCRDGAPPKEPEIRFDMLGAP